MTTGDEEAESLVDNLFREVDDQFKDLEREYHQAREDLATADGDRRDTPIDALEASNERFALQSQVASLQAEVSRQADELDERDRMLGQLGENIAGFEADIARRDEMLNELHETKQQVLDERREQARLASLLDARAAERHELAEVAQRLQNERDHVQELLTTALARFDEVDAVRIQMDDKLRHLEAARDTASHEHDARAHELIESRAEMSKLADQLEELSRTATAADQRADKAEALAERRANEAGYLNRRIDALNDKLTEAGNLDDELTTVRRELAMGERRVTELERELATSESEATAANAAVDAIAERTADYDELVARVEQLTEERDAAWEAASGHAATPDSTVEETPQVGAAEVASLADQARELSGRRATEPEVVSLADQARELSARRSNEAEAAAQAAEVAAARAAAAAEEAAALAAQPEPEAPALDIAVPANDDAGEIHVADVGAEPEAEEAAEEVPESDELEDLDDTDVDVIEADLAHLAPEPEAVGVAEQELPPPPPPAPIEPSADETNEATETSQAESEIAASLDQDMIPVVSLDHLELQDPLTSTAEIPAISPEAAQADGEPAAPLLPVVSDSRQRTILPAELVPNTAEAVAFLLNQPGVTAIVDARSTCGRTGIRPSELFDRVAMLRDHFDVPVEVVVTPVSTPVGGAPDLPAIGVHHVTGADTVADRIRALCMGFPADQPLVVVAGDDHVRRAAIGEEANVVEPSAVLNVEAD